MRLLFLTANDAQTWDIRVNGAHGDNSFEIVDTTASIRFKAGSTEICSDRKLTGNVGIGTNAPGIAYSPKAPLNVHVSGSDAAGFFLTEYY